MRHSDWLQPTQSKAALAALGLGLQCLALLVFANSGRLPVAAAVAAAAAAAVFMTSRSPTAAVAVSSIVTLTAPLVVFDGTSLIFTFIAALVVYSWAETIRPLPTFAFGATVIAANEILSEVVEEAAEDGTPWRESLNAGYVASSVLEALVIAALVVGLGLVIAVTRRQAAAMVGLERSNGELALDAERHRIARDLHDVAAHHLSSIVVRTSTARKVGDAASMREAVAFAGDTAGEALAAMRHIVTILRSDQGTTQPSLRDLDKVVDISQAAGLRVSASMDSAALDRLGSSADLALSRVVQEGLANVVQHSSAQAADVRLDVQDTGSRQWARLAIADPGPPAPGDTAGGGLGLIGMRERVEALGGTFTVGPSKGRWLIEATVPLGATEGELT